MFFLHEKSFVQVETMFFKLKFGENSPVKESVVRTQDHTHRVFISNLLSRCVGDLPQEDLSPVYTRNHE
jgi:hypothetical protein